MGRGTAATTAPAAPPTMKLLVDTGAQRVVFAEAGKDVVDFILGLLAMPLGAADRLLAGDGGGGGALGSIANVYASVQRMDAAYVQSAAARDALLLDPAATPPRHSSAFKSPFSEPTLSFAPAVPPMFTDDLTAPSFSTPTLGIGFQSGVLPARPEPPPPPPPPSSTIKNHALPLYLYRCDACRAARLPKGSGGFVKDLATSSYTVTDDLTVAPTSSASSTVALLKSFGVKDLDALEERTVSVGHQEALGILEAALRSKTVLTDAFLANKSKKRVRPSGDDDKDGTGSSSE